MKKSIKKLAKKMGKRLLAFFLIFTMIFSTNVSSAIKIINSEVLENNEVEENVAEIGEELSTSEAEKEDVLLEENSKGELLGEDGIATNLKEPKEEAEENESNDEEKEEDEITDEAPSEEDLAAEEEPEEDELSDEEPEEEKTNEEESLEGDLAAEEELDDESKAEETEEEKTDEEESLESDLGAEEELDDESKAEEIEEEKADEEESLESDLGAEEELDDELKAEEIEEEKANEEESLETDLGAEETKENESNALEIEEEESTLEELEESESNLEETEEGKITEEETKENEINAEESVEGLNAEETKENESSVEVTKEVESNKEENTSINDTTNLETESKESIESSENSENIEGSESVESKALVDDLSINDDKKEEDLSEILASTSEADKKEIELEENKDGKVLFGGTMTVTVSRNTDGGTYEVSGSNVSVTINITSGGDGGTGWAASPTTLSLGKLKKDAHWFEGWTVVTSDNLTWSPNLVTTTYTDQANDQGQLSYSRSRSVLVGATNTGGSISIAATAKWRKKIWGIALNRNGGSGGPDKIYEWHTKSIHTDVSCNTTAVTSITPPTKSGCTFLGYYRNGTQYINSSGTFVNGLNGGSVFNDNVELTAEWRQIATVTLHKNNGTTEANPKTLYVDIGKQIYTNNTYTTVWDGSIGTLPTRTGYKFKGFNSNTSGTGTDYINDKGVRISSSFTLNTFTSTSNTIYAKWEPNVYHITIDKDGGSGGTSELWLKYNTGKYSNSACSTSISSLTKPTKTNYLFAGYYDETLTTQYVTDGGAFTSSFSNTAWSSDDTTSPIKLKAKWVPIYTIKLDNNGGTGVNPDTLYVTAGVGTSISPGVYKNIACTSGYQFTSLTTKPTRSNKKFKGFVKDPGVGSGSGTVYINESGAPTTDFNAGQFTLMTTSIYAKWESEVYTITLNSNGATSAGTTQLFEKYGEGIFTSSACSGSSITSITKPTKTGATFLGYFRNGVQYIDGSGNLLPTFTNILFSDNTGELTAEWREVLTLTLMKNGGDTDAAPSPLYLDKGKQIYTNDTCTIIWDNKLATLPKRSGYKFKGFNSLANGTGVEYIRQDGTRNTSTFTVNTFTGNTEFHAQWENNIYQINFNQDGGTGGTNSLWVKYNTGIYTNSGCSATIPANLAVPTKTNYLFAGYYDSTLTTQYVDIDGSITSSFTNTTWNHDDTTTPIEMKAKWIPIYYIKLDTNGGTSVDPSELYVTAGIGSVAPGVYTDVSCSPTTKFITLSTPPTKAHRTFKGFVKNPSAGVGSGTTYIDQTGHPSGSFIASEFVLMNTSIYAKWDPNVYKITLNSSGAATQGTRYLYEMYDTGIYDNEDCVGTKLTSLPTLPTKGTSTFLGYYLGSTQYIDGSGYFTSNFTSTTFGGPIELEAHWGEVYEISLNKNNGNTDVVPNKVYVNNGVGLYENYGCSVPWNGKITTKPTRYGYTYKGFGGDPDGGGTEYVGEDGYINSTNFTKDSFSGDKQIYAKWEKNIYHIEISQDGGTSGTSELWVKYDDGIYTNSTCTNAIAPPLGVPVKDNYLFAGYYDKALTTQYVTANGALTANFTTTAWNYADTTKSVEMIAKWVPIYKIELNSNGGSGVSPTEVYITDGNENVAGGVYKELACTTPFTSITAAPTKSHRVFKGFVREPEGGAGSGTMYIDDAGDITASFTASEFSGNSKIYAKWDPEVYEITLRSDGAVVSGTTKLYEKYGEGIYGFPDCSGGQVNSITIPSTTDSVFAGYFFNGNKYIDESGHFTPYFTNTAFDGARELTVQWSQVYEVKLEKNGGDTEASPNRIYVKNGVGLFTDVNCLFPWEDRLTVIPARAGYKFRGFGGETDGSGIGYIREDGYKNATNFTHGSFTGHTTIYAKWENNVYHVEIDQNDGVGGTSDLWVKYADGIYTNSGCSAPIGAAIGVPTRANYLFAGYFDKTMTIQYVNSSGVLNVSNFTKTTWNYDDTTKSIEMKAKWIPIYKIELDCNGGTGVDPIELFVTEGTDTKPAGVYKDAVCSIGFSTLITKPNKTHKNFKGFVKEASGGKGSGTVYINDAGAPTASFVASEFGANKKIYAMWESKIYSIHLTSDEALLTPGTEWLYEKYEEGIYGESDPSCTGDVVTSITIPTRTDDVFTGYYRNGIKYIDENGNFTSNFTNIAFEDHVEFKAQWSHLYLVSFDSNDGDVEPVPDKVYVKSGVGIYKDVNCEFAWEDELSTKPTKAGYKYKGFGANPDGSGAVFINESGHRDVVNFTMNSFIAHTSIYAKWESNIYHINFDQNDGMGGTNELWVKYADNIYTNSGCTTPIGASIAVPIRVNYLFDGYYDRTLNTRYVKEDGTLDTANFTTTNWGYSDTAVPVEMKAKWVPVYKIHLDNNGGNGVSPIDLYVTEGTEDKAAGVYLESTCDTLFTTLTTLPTNPGKEFRGFVKNASGGIGSGTLYIDQTGLPTVNFVASEFGGNKDIFAKWESVGAAIYEINLNNNGADEPGTMKLYEKYGEGIFGEDDPGCSGDVVTSITKPSKHGYSFKGYFDNALEIPYISQVGSFLSTFNCVTFEGNAEIRAKWENNIYTIDFDDDGANEGQKGTRNLYVKYDVGIYPTIACAGIVASKIDEKPVKENFAFDGYYIGNVEYIKADGTINSVNFTPTRWSSDDVTTHITMKAKWIPVHKITLNNNTLDADSIEALPSELWLKEGEGIFEDVMCNTPFTKLKFTPTRPKYGFMGFVENADGSGAKYINVDGTITDAFASVNWTSDREIYAIWGTGLYRIAFNKNGGDTEVEPSQVYVKKGVGIYTTTECNVPWTGPITVKPTRAGYRFNGLYENPDGTGLEYIQANGLVNTTNFRKDAFTEDAVLYTKWENNVYTVQLEKDGGAGGDNKLYISYEKGIYKDLGCTTVVTEVEKPEKEGFAFAGYYDVGMTIEYIKADGTINEANFNSRTWSSTDTITPIIMLAKWVTVHKVTLDKNGGDTDPSPKELWLEEGIGIFIDEKCTTKFTGIKEDPTKEDFGFHGFVENPDGSGIEYITGEGLINSDNFDDSTFLTDTVIYAKWGEPLYRITLDNDEATEEGTLRLYEKYNVGIYGDYACTTEKTSIIPPTKINNIFDGYYDSETMTTQYIKPNGEINTDNFTNTTFNKPATLKARWITKTYKITLNGNGGDNIGISELHEKYGVGLYIDSECTYEAKEVEIPVKEGFIFDGYYNNNEGLGEKYINENGVINEEIFTNKAFNKNTEIFANYIEIYRINLDTGGGISTVKTLYKIDGDNNIYSDAGCLELATTIKKPVKSGHSFYGYWTEQNKKGIMCIDNRGNIKNEAFENGNMTIYPYFEKASGGGTGGGSGGGGGGGAGGSSLGGVSTGGILSSKRDMIRYWNDNNIVVADDAIVYDEKTNMYKYSKDNTPVSNKWVGEPGAGNKTVWHYVDDSSKLLTGWNTIGDSIYYFDINGDMLTGKQEINGIVYYFNENQDGDEGKLCDESEVVKKEPKMAIAFDQYQNKYYYENGVQVANQWVSELDENGAVVWRYADANGEKQRWWLDVDGARYFFDAYGKMLTGYQDINGITLYFNEEKGPNEGKLVI